MRIAILLQPECLTQLECFLSIQDSDLRLILAVILLVLRLSRNVVLNNILHVWNV